jgi:hypothetical protein
VIPMDGPQAVTERIQLLDKLDIDQVGTRLVSELASVVERLRRVVGGSGDILVCQRLHTPSMMLEERFMSISALPVSQLGIWRTKLRHRPNNIVQTPRTVKQRQAQRVEGQRAQPIGTKLCERRLVEIGANQRQPLPECPQRLAMATTGQRCCQRTRQRSRIWDLRIAVPGKQSRCKPKLKRRSELRHDRVRGQSGSALFHGTPVLPKDKPLLERRESDF